MLLRGLATHGAVDAAVQGGQQQEAQHGQHARGDGWVPQAHDAEPLLQFCGLKRAPCAWKAAHIRRIDRCEMRCGVAAQQQVALAAQHALGKGGLQAQREEQQVGLQACESAQRRQALVG